MGKYCRQHIGKTFNDGKLIVVDGSDKRHYVKVKCRVCAEDSELFGDGVFEAPFVNINSERLPCGCAYAYKWTIKQYEIRIKRKIELENLSIRFVGFGELKKKLAMTPVKMMCSRSNIEYQISSIKHFFEGSGNIGKTYSTDAKIEQYNKDNQKYTVWNSGKRINNGQVICGFYCKTCESNMFESLFEITASSLFAGKIPCYCSKAKMNISGDHIVELTKRKLDAASLNTVTVIGAHKNKGHWYPVFVCDIHGVYSRPYGSLSTVGCHCVRCNPSAGGYDKTKQGFLYLLEIQKDSLTILGYGITNNISKRLATHKCTFKGRGYEILSSRIFEGTGTQVLSTENRIKELHTTGLLDCEGFRRESISIDMKDKVLEKCKKLKELDNPNKLI